MKTQHTSYHWVLVALALATLLLTFGEAHGQSGAAAVVRSPASDVTLRKDAAPARDKSVAKEQRSAKKVVRATKRSLSRARHGVSEIDTRAAGAGPAR